MKLTDREIEEIEKENDILQNSNKIACAKVEVLADELATANATVERLEEALNPDSVEDYINRLHWSGNEAITLVAGNIRGFVSHLRETLSPDSKEK